MIGIMTVIVFPTYPEASALKASGVLYTQGIK
jgi:hypothetical protein